MGFSVSSAPPHFQTVVLQNFLSILLTTPISSRCRSYVETNILDSDRATAFSDGRGPEQNRHWRSRIYGQFEGLAVESRRIQIPEEYGWSCRTLTSLHSWNTERRFILPEVKEELSPTYLCVALEPNPPMPKWWSSVCRIPVLWPAFVTFFAVSRLRL